MKYMVASDIHGSAKYCELMLKAFAEEKADRLLLLGDLLYHGPRNDLPEEYNPKKVIELLNEVKDKIICVRGNCDAEVDQMVLQFPIMADYFIFETNERLVVATHGHIFNPSNPMPFVDGSILLNGHTHVSCRKEISTNGRKFTYINPGSVAIPKAGTPHSYILFDDDRFLWKNLETGEEYEPGDNVN